MSRPRVVGEDDNEHIKEPKRARFTCLSWGAGRGRRQTQKTHPAGVFFVFVVGSGMR